MYLSVAKRTSSVVPKAASLPWKAPWESFQLMWEHYHFPQVNIKTRCSGGSGFLDPKYDIVTNWSYWGLLLLSCSVYNTFCRHTVPKCFHLSILLLSVKVNSKILKFNSCIYFNLLKFFFFLHLDHYDKKYSPMFVFWFTNKITFITIPPLLLDEVSSFLAWRMYFTVTA